MKPYTEWEDFLAGMYSCHPAKDESMVESARKLLADRHRLMAAMRSVVIAWSNACEANLSESPNNRSWLGQAACCFALGVPEHLTRLAWGQLADCERIAANAIADHVIDERNRQFKSVIQLEFLFDA